jgi:hypothetical protein
VKTTPRDVFQLTFPGILLISLSLCACGGGSGQSAAPASTTMSAPAPPSGVTKESGDAWLGQYVGSVTIAGVQYFADAMLTADGLIRLYVAGPIDADYGGGNAGNLPGTVPATSAQLVGTLQGPTNQISGDGLVFGQQCEAPNPIQFCAEIGHANISVAYSTGADFPVIQGDILVTTSAGTETWSLNMSLYGPNYIGLSTPEDIAGIYKEELADFALSGDTLITIDDKGVLFFQSASSGCTGNGQVQPHLNGAQNIFDVTMTISDCNTQYSYFNGKYDGLATTTTSSEWDYDSNLRMWLSQPDPDVSGPSPPALTTWAPQN